MKIATARRMGWIVPALALTFGFAAINPISAQNNAPEKTTKAKTERPRSKTLMGTFSRADATALTIKGTKEEMSANLVPTTVFWRTQKGVAPADLKIGEIVKLNLAGTDDMGRVESLSPLTLKFGDNATLIYDKPGKTKFERISKITATDVIAGHKGKVAGNVYADGRIEAREVWVEVEPEKKATTKKQ